MLVLAMGCFDLLHVAHIRHLQEARKMGSSLVVGVTMDAYVNKPGRPILNQWERLEMVEALGCVSHAFLCEDSIDALQHFEEPPGIFVKGSDYLFKGLLPEELKFCEEHNIEIRFTKPNPQTTSGIVERICGSQLQAA